MNKRQIKMNYRNVTGVASSQKVSRLIQFESTLEYAAIIHFEYETGIPFYDEQPITLQYILEDEKRRYTPDFLVNVRKTNSLFNVVGNYLIEIKHRSDLWKNWNELKPKFVAAKKHAKEHGMKFKILTDNELRTPYFENIQFLNRYKHIDIQSADANEMMNIIHEHRSLTVQELLNKISTDKWYQARVIPLIWNKIFNRLIIADLTVPLTMKTIIHW